MSIETRYWCRTEPNGKLVFFPTGTAAAHSRAEGDSRAKEISSEEFEAVVPAEARGTEFWPDGKPEPAQDKQHVNHAAPEPPNPAALKAQHIGEHQAATVQAMMGAHEAIVKVLQSFPFTTAEQVFILTMTKQQIINSMFQVMPANMAPGPAVAHRGH